MLTRHLMSKDIITAKKDIPIKECIEILFKRHVGSVVVTDEQRKCVGIFTERDALRVVAQNFPLDTPLEKVMTTNVYTISENSTFDEAKKIMRLYKIRHLPVVNAEGRLAGLLSMRKILDDLFEE